MKILMLSIDKGLLGKNPMGDVIERHKKYGEFCEQLDIVVFSKVHYEKQKLSNNVFVYSTNSLTRYNFFFDAYKIGKKLFKENYYQLIIGDFFSGLSAWWLKKKFKSKLLLTLHGDFWHNKAGLQSLWHNYFLLFFNKILLKKVDSLRVVSNSLKNKLIKMGVNPEKVWVIPVAVDWQKINQFDPQIKKEIENNFPGKIILFIGRLDAVKNLSWFLDVFKKVAEQYIGSVKLVIAGQGVEEKNLNAKVQQLNIEDRVKFVGQIPHNELPNYLAACNILVLPSLSESFGKVLIEAGAAGKPVVATMTTGAKEIVENGVTGFLTPIGDAEAMAEAILKLLNNTDLAEKMGAQAKEYIKQNFDGNVNLQKIKEMWSKIVNDKT